jgi:hypothetical protein
MCLRTPRENENGGACLFFLALLLWRERIEVRVLCRGDRRSPWTSPLPSPASGRGSFGIFEGGHEENEVVVGAGFKPALSFEPFVSFVVK